MRKQVTNIFLLESMREGTNPASKILLHVHYILKALTVVNQQLR